MFSKIIGILSSIFSGIGVFVLERVFKKQTSKTADISVKKSEKIKFRKAKIKNSKINVKGSKDVDFSGSEIG